MVQQYVQDLQPDLVPKYKPDSFNCPLRDVTQGAIHLWGKSGTGKTQYALAHFKKPLLIRHIDDLQKLQPYVKHDGIVFDDVSFIKVI